MLVLSTAMGQVPTVPVFTAGTEGHQSYRIPAVLAWPDGQLLAFAEGRVHGSADFGDINIVMKRSSDGGKTWSPLQTVVDYDQLQAGNPAPVVDLTDPRYPGGRLFLFYNTGNNHENEVRNGKGWREVWYKASVDAGRTWSDAVNITTQVHRPLQLAAKAAYAFAEDWRSYANTPGHATQFRSGVYKGRIFVAANHSAGPPQPQFQDYAAHGFYTDDHGETFQLAASLPVPGSNEATAAVLSHGRLLLNSRNQRGDVRARIVAISSTGGQTWDTTYFDKALPDPVCQGSLLELYDRRGKRSHRRPAVLAFCNAADTLRRDRLTLRLSYDEGRTWPVSHLVYQQPALPDAAAYSDLVPIGRRQVGVLFEKDNYAQIAFGILTWR